MYSICKFQVYLSLKTFLEPRDSLTALSSMGMNCRRSSLPRFWALFSISEIHWYDDDDDDDDDNDNYTQNHLYYFRLIYIKIACTKSLQEFLSKKSH